MKIIVMCGATYVSGMEIDALDLAAGLRDRGHEVRVVVNGWNDGDFCSRLDALGICWKALKFGKLTRSLSPIHVKWMLSTLLHWPTALVRLWWEFKQYQPDVVVLYNRDAALLASPVLSRQKCVFRVAEIGEANAWYRRMYTILDDVVDHWVGVSSFIGRRLLEMGMPREKVSVIPHGFAAAPLVRSEGALYTVGICGQVGVWKGHEDLIDALSLLRLKGTAFRCLIFGTGSSEFEHHLGQRIAELGLTDVVEWRGFVKDKETMYGELDVLVVPTRSQEPFGMVAAEAAMRGLPVVATCRGGLSEVVVDGETGYIVDAERPDQIARRLAELATAPEKRERMGLAGRERVASLYGINRMVDSHDELLSSLEAGSDYRTPPVTGVTLL